MHTQKDTYIHLPVISVGCWLSIVKWDGEQAGGIKGGGRSPTAVPCEPAGKKEKRYRADILL